MVCILAISLAASSGFSVEAGRPDIIREEGREEKGWPLAADGRGLGPSARQKLQGGSKCPALRPACCVFCLLPSGLFVHKNGKTLHAQGCGEAWLAPEVPGAGASRPPHPDRSGLYWRGVFRGGTGELRAAPSGSRVAAQRSARRPHLLINPRWDSSASCHSHSLSPASERRPNASR